MTRKAPNQISHDAPQTATLLVGLELSSSSWKLAFGCAGVAKPRIRSIDAWNLEAFADELVAARKRLGLAADSDALVCMEAGRDGFSVHRALQSQLQQESIVIDPSSIETSRRGRRAKTDRLDAIKLQEKLGQWLRGDRKVWAVNRVPTVEQEDARRQTRERERLVDERRRHSNRIKSLLVTVGLEATVDQHFPAWLDAAVTPYGSPVPPHLRAELLRQFERLSLARRQLRDVESALKQGVAEGTTEADVMARRLIELRGIGLVSASLLAYEFFGWRRFDNRRQVGSAAGLTGTPHNSGESERDQGIDKAGNKRVRTLMVELAWCWLRHQGDSELSRWFTKRFGPGGKRNRRIGITALARKLLVALWKYLTYGIVPDGAKLQPALKATAASAAK